MVMSTVPTSGTINVPTQNKGKKVQDEGVLIDRTNILMSRLKYHANN